VFISNEQLIELAKIAQAKADNWTAKIDEMCQSSIPIVAEIGKQLKKEDDRVKGNV
jgi:hypothetical protein